MKSKPLSLFLILITLFGCGHESTATLSNCFKSISSAIPFLATSTPDSIRWVRYLPIELRYDTTLFTNAQPVSELRDKSLFEASGIAPSRQHPGHLWLEEDSGNPNQIQLLNPQGRVVGRYTLPDIANRDWEDIAVGAGPVAGQSYVYLAEIGDNLSIRPTKTIYRFREPVIAGKTQPVDETITSIDAIRLQLPDGTRNAEAMLVDPLNLDIYLFSKEDRCIVYRAPYPQSLTETTTMQRLLALPFFKVTSASISSDGRQILIRTYEQLFYYTRRPGESVIDALNRAPLRIPLATEPQGEAVGWAPDGLSYYTTSEKPDAQPQVIYRYSRKP